MAFPGKRVLTPFVAVVALVVSAVGPVRAAGAAERERPRVVFVNPGVTGEVFWTLVSRTMQEAADQFGIDLTIDVAERNRVRMKQLALATIHGANKPDVLVLVNEEQASVELMKQADAHGIKVLMLLNDIVGDDRKQTGEPGQRYRNWLGAIVPDNRGAGRRMAEALGRFAEDRGLEAPGDSGERPIIALYGDTVTPASIDRNGGLAEVLGEGGDRLTLDHALIADWDEDKAHDLVDRVLKHYARQGARRPVGVWAANDAMALGAIRALRENGLLAGTDVGVAGLNWSPAALAAISSGTLVTSDGGHFFAGAWAMVVLKDYFSGLDLPASPPTIAFSMSPVDAGNIDAFRAAIGDVIEREAFDEIDFSRFLIGPHGDPSAYDFTLDALAAAVEPVQQAQQAQQAQKDCSGRCALTSAH
ncbi:monosaccharide ABC transporter substrate-binding protein (CUT2 family) [Breoghania corrubedonensis]|uniref:Monosaccharide ABC transporter substrate-binding protein (CUT2 family) n=1 Tax=Breoghania corrubedonensis TaxID=665038 RepID=A0A2T5VD95_9HYPH|nr:ABC transporter substrate-binding protein [Breoghania corrubedonensis]PTW61737.1 monosaccharide ABC transporter substrate-binding protein (CUT2 family) [Breoghania corrubedonensis]